MLGKGRMIIRASAQFFLVLFVPVAVGGCLGYFYKMPWFNVLMFLSIWLGGVSFFYFFAKYKLDTKINTITTLLAKIKEGDFESEIDPKLLNKGKIFATAAAGYTAVKDGLTGIFTGFNSINYISQNLNQAVKDVSTSAQSIEFAASTIAHGAVSQARDVESCAQLSETMVDKMEIMAGLAAGITEEVGKTSAIETEGEEKLSQLLAKSETLSEVTGEVIAKITRLVTDAKNIANITDAMSTLSRRTRMLSLNASIEAARTGESGRGFMVVAEEIRKLSDQSAAAVSNISEITAKIFDELGEVQDGIDRVQQVYLEQKTAVGLVTEALQKVGGFMKAVEQQETDFCNQFDGLNSIKDQLNMSISNVAAVTQEFVATTEELASLTMSQGHAAASLVDMCNTLEENVALVTTEQAKFRLKEVGEAQKKLAVIFNCNISFWDTMKETARNTAAKYRIGVDFFAPETYDYKLQNNIVRRVIDEGYHGFVISPVEGDKSVNLVNEATQKGMKVITVGSPVPNTKSNFMETNCIKGGQAAAVIALKMLEGKKGTILVNHWADLRQDSIDNRENGFCDELKKYPDIRLIKADAPSDPAGKSDEIAKQLLAQYPDVDLIFTTNAMWGIYFAAYFAKHGIKKKLVTFDSLPEINDYIHSGVIQAAIAQRPFAWGELSVKWFADALKGVAIPDYFDTGTFEINAANLPVFDKRFTKTA